MARKILACVVLAGICLVIGGVTLDLDLGAPADAAVRFDGVMNQPWGDCLSDTTGDATADSVTIHATEIHRWSIKAYGSYDLTYKFKRVNSDSISGAGYIESLAGEPDVWEVAPEWIKIKSLDAENATRWVINVQGFHDGTAGAHVITDTTAGGKAVTWPS